MGRPLKIKKGSAAGDAVIGVTIGTAGTYTVVPTVSFAAPPAGGVQATGTPNFAGVSATAGGAATIAYSAADVLTVGSATFNPVLTAATAGVGLTATTDTAGTVTVDSGNYIVGQSVTMTNAAAAALGLANGTTYYVMVGGTGVTSIQLTDSYANAVAGIPGLTTVVGGPVAATFTLGSTYNTVASVTLVAGGSNSAPPANPATPTTSGSGTGVTLTVTYGVANITITNGGSGYISVPAISFVGGTGGAAAATAVMGNAGGAVDKDIGFNIFSLLDQPTVVIPAGMTASQYLGVVGGGYPGGVATAQYPTVACTAWIPGDTGENPAYIITQKGQTKYLLASQVQNAVTTIVPGQAYIIGAIGTTTNWAAVGASINAQEGDVFTATAVGTGDGTVSFVGSCVLTNLASGALTTAGQMQITFTVNSTVIQASKLTNKYVWDYSVPAIKYAADFFVGSAAAVYTAGSGAQVDTWVNGTGNYELGQVTDYTS